MQNIDDITIADNKKYNKLFSWQEVEYIKLTKISLISSSGNVESNSSNYSGILLYGAPRLGIEQLAFYWIKTILCESTTDTINNIIHPCNSCHSCLLFENSSHPNLYSLDENRLQQTNCKIISVDMIREAVEFLHLSPSNNKQQKILFIPDLNLLNSNSANALLKVLEEPPQYAKLILVSTNINKVLPTIKSRCIKHLVAKPNKTMVPNILQEIMYEYIGANEENDKEKLTIAIKTNDIKKNEWLINFWLHYHDNCPFFEQDHLSYDELNNLITILTTPNIVNIFSITQIIDGKEIKFAFFVDFLQKWLTDILLCSATQQVIYFNDFKQQLTKLVNKINLKHLFYLQDRLSFLQNWTNHSLNYKIQIENLMLQYQSIFN